MKENSANPAAIMRTVIITSNVLMTLRFFMTSRLYHLERMNIRIVTFNLKE